MIVNLQRFLEAERPRWEQLESALNHIEKNPRSRMTLQELREFQTLYERAAADLAQLASFSTEPETRRYLEQLVARAYGEIHETRQRRRRLQPFQWFFQTLPQTFRAHINAFWLSVAVTCVGMIFGGMALAFDPEAKAIIMPFEHLQGDPADRVAQEEAGGDEGLSSAHASFSAMLMTHNTRVSIMTMSFGMTWGIGTLILLFYNGIILGAVALDYIAAGQLKFLLGWLMPHGVIEIPAILIAGQAGFLLAKALIGRGTNKSIGTRLREISPSVVTLIFGVALLLVWAGFVEAFLSQYHEPVLPYEAKIGFGSVELLLLILFLSRSGRKAPEPPLP